MRRELLVVALAGALAGCAGAKLDLGVRKDGVVVEAEGACPPGALAGPAEPCGAEEAQRRAVQSLLPLYLSSQTISGSEALLSQNILARPGDFIKNYKVLGTERRGETPVTTLRALVEVAKLRRQLDALGLAKPEGVQGTPKILVSLVETGLGAGSDVGRASDSLRRALSARGYEAFDFSDQLNKKLRKTGSADEALAAGRAQKADVVVSGVAQTEERRDQALSGYRSFRARIQARILAPASGEEFGLIETEATAVDLHPEGAAVKALENAGDSAAEKLAGRLVERFKERTEIGMLLLEPPAWEKLRGFLEALRLIPGVAAVSLAGLSPKEARIRIFVEKVSTDELAAAVRTLSGYSLELRVVEPDARYIELEWRKE